MENGKLSPGVDYPRTFEEMDDWFRSEDGCRDYIRRLRWPDGFFCRHCGAIEEPRVMARGVFRCKGVRRRNVADRRYGVPGHTRAVAHVAPCDVVHHQPEEWCQRPGLAAGVGPG